MTDRRFVSLDFEKGRISAWISIAGNRPVRSRVLGDYPPEDLRKLPFDERTIEKFRLTPWDVASTPDKEPA